MKTSVVWVVVGLFVSSDGHTLVYHPSESFTAEALALGWPKAALGCLGYFLGGPLITAWHIVQQTFCGVDVRCDMSYLRMHPFFLTHFYL